MKKTKLLSLLLAALLLSALGACLLSLGRSIRSYHLHLDCP